MRLIWRPSALEDPKHRLEFTRADRFREPQNEPVEERRGANAPTSGSALISKSQRSGKPSHRWRLEILQHSWLSNS